MSKRRLRTTDYNEDPGRIARTTSWWFAPKSVSRKSKQNWGLFLLILVGALVAMLIINLTSSDPVNQTPTAAAPTAAPTVKSNCPEAPAVDVPPEILIGTAYQSTWVRDGDMQRPTSETAGPGKANPYPSCFSRTPEGALYSAASFASGVISATAAGDEKPFFVSRSSHSGNYTVLIADLPDAGPTQNRPTVKFSGYRWNSYTPDLASVEIRYTLITGPRAGSNTAITYTMAWESNDWLLVIPGKNDTAAAPVDSTRTYIPWGGQT